MDGYTVAESPLARTAGTMYDRQVIRELPCNVELESKSGVTPLVAACYRLRPGDVARLLDKGADPNHQAGFAGGVSPALAVLLAVADAVDIGRRQIDLLGDARHSAQIWTLLSARGGSWEFPINIIVGRAVMRLLQDAAAQENNSFLLVNLVRAEERMYKEEY